MNQTRERGFESQTIRYSQPFRLPVLDGPKNSSKYYTPSPLHNKGQHPQTRINNSYRQDSQDDEEIPESRKVRDPNDLNHFVPYSHNPLHHGKNNNTIYLQGQRSISVPHKKELLYEQEHVHEPKHQIRNNKPQLSSDYTVSRTITPLKPVSNLTHKSYLASLNSLDEEFQRSRKLNQSNLDFSILNREAELLPAAAEINARRGISQRPIIKAVEHKHAPEKRHFAEDKEASEFKNPVSALPTDHKETKEPKAFQVNTVTTPTKIGKPVHHVTIKEPNDPDHIPFRKPGDYSHSVNAANPLLKNSRLDSLRSQPQANHKDPQAKKHDRHSSTLPLTFERQSLIIFKPSTTITNDKPEDIRNPSSQNKKEVFTPTHTRVDFLKDFGELINKQSASNQFVKPASLLTLITSTVYLHGLIVLHIP